MVLMASPILMRTLICAVKIKGYLISSLKSYKARERSGGLAVLMQQQADALSDQDIEDIAHFYSALGSLSHP